MEKQRWNEIKEIFAEMIEHPTASREELLRQRANGDADLYSEVLSLIAAADAPENLIELNAIDLAGKVVTGEDEYTNRRFGKYRILKEIGSGGMGTVFLAERDDGEFSMRVALKIVRQSIADAAIISRFKQERQILADLHHPNIAALHDGGISANGEPYLAMEYVEGETLTEYCTDRDLSIKDRLDIFLKVCSAVAYAHRNLVVHRDIKPSNIVVTSDGQPKLLDFGLAGTFAEDSSRTQTAVRAFTPAYASPEQIMGAAISTASDQYSLGVVLFELISGTKPFDFDGKTVPQMIASIESGDVASPSRVASTSGAKLHRESFSSIRDLDNITLKALRKEAERRYTSVEAFAEDIERYLTGRPVNARPNTISYRASRFVSRNRTGVVAAGIVVLAILTAMGISIWQATVAGRERDRAEQRFQEVRRISNSLLFEIAPKIERLPGSTEARELLVVRALEYLDSLASESNDVKLQAELAQAYQQIGDLQGNPARPNLSDFAGAIESYQKSKQILERLPATIDNRLKLAATYHQLSKTRFVQSEIQASFADAETALEIYHSLLETSPQDDRILRTLVAAEIDLARNYSLNNQFESAIPLYRQALGRLASKDPSDRDVGRLLAVGTAYLSNGLSWNGQQDEAEFENEKAVEYAETLRSQFPNDTEIQRAAFIVYMMASSTYETIRNDVSLRYAGKALAVAQATTRADTADNQAAQNLARALSRRGNLLILMKSVDEGFEHLRSAEQTLLELVGREPRSVVYQSDLGALYTRFGDAEKSRRDLFRALMEYQRSAAIFAKLAANESGNLFARRDWAQAVKNVGESYAALGQIESARDSLRLAIDITKQLREQRALGKWDEKAFDEMLTLYKRMS